MSPTSLRPPALGPYTPGVAPAPALAAGAEAVAASASPADVVPHAARSVPVRRGGSPDRGTFHVAGVGVPLAALKLAGLVGWSWRWVLAPFRAAGAVMIAGRFVVDLHEVL